jgi:hypothetical protein
MEVANCKGVTQFHIPDGSETPKERRAREAFAKWLCTGCPLLQQCREWGIQAENVPPGAAPHGVWGGMTRPELLTLAKPRTQHTAHRLVRLTPGNWGCRCGHAVYGAPGKGGKVCAELHKRHLMELAQTA